MRGDDVLRGFRRETGVGQDLVCEYLTEIEVLLSKADTCNIISVGHRITMATIERPVAESSFLPQCLSPFAFVLVSGFILRFTGELVLRVCHLQQQGNDGKVLTVEGSHRYAKVIRLFGFGAYGGKKPVHCMLTFFNEPEQARIFSKQRWDIETRDKD